MSFTTASSRRPRLGPAGIRGGTASRRRRPELKGPGRTTRGSDGSKATWKWGTRGSTDRSSKHASPRNRASSASIDSLRTLRSLSLSTPPNCGGVLSATTTNSNWRLALATSLRRARLARLPSSRYRHLLDCSRTRAHHQRPRVRGGSQARSESTRRKPVTCGQIGRIYPRAPPDQPSDWSATEDCKVRA
jgi:hypothetical protein